jgi:hypothetical protein
MKTNAEAAEDFHAQVRVHSFSKWGECIECDNCGGLARVWGYAPDHSRFCRECLKDKELSDPHHIN